MKRVRRAAFFLCSCVLLWSALPFVSRAATSTVITENTTFSPGEYRFDTLTIASSSTLTLLGDPATTTPFKGVIIYAENLTVESGSSISANGKGYAANEGPGVSSLHGAGASHGGIGASNAATTATTYGSALEPMELGSGGAAPGGGAMQLFVSGTFTNDGILSADGRASASGGSIFVNAGTLAGIGSFTALGGGLWSSGYYKQPGGGGRIMIRYSSSSFLGTVDASGGCGGPDYARSCGSGGTAGFIDMTTNTLFPKSWRFQANDSPFSFASIVLAKGDASSEPDVSISTDQLLLSSQSSVSFSDGVHLRASLVSLDEASMLGFSGTTDVVIDDLKILGGSKVVTGTGKRLDLSLADLIVSDGSRIDVTASGYGPMQGPGAPYESTGGIGASHGGRGSGNTATSTYGDANEPIDFGSGGSRAGGGALALTISGIFTNNGTVAADGSWSGSGGSILVHAHEIHGSGKFSANGTGKDTTSYLGPGGGGRIALYTTTATSSFTGKVEAKGACNSGVGYTYCGDDGTVVFEDTSPKISNVLFLPGIEGSRLYEGVGCGKPAEERLWEPVAESTLGILSGLFSGAGDAKVRDLALDPTGASACSDIYVKEGDVVDSVRSSHIYKSFIDEMNGLAAEGAITGWEPVAYDWRLSLDDLLSKGAERDGKVYYEEATSTPYIEQTLRALAARSKTKKVTVVAHSNGGLVTKALLNKLGSEAASLVDRVILVGVPQSGAPQDVGSMLVGHNAGIYAGKGFLPVVSNVAARAFLQNSPMAYHLLPSQSYFDSVMYDPAHPVASFAGDAYAKEETAYGNAIGTATELTDFLLAKEGGRVKPEEGDLRSAEILSSSLIDYANSQHATLDSWTPPSGIEADQIAGWGVDTVSGIDFYSAVPAIAGPSAAVDGSGLDVEKKYRPTFVEDGDGVVPVPSALMMSESESVKRYWLDLFAYNKETNSERKHKDLFEIPSLEEFIKNIITNSTSSLPAYISTTQPATETESKKLTFFLHSPLTLQITDTASGSVTGLAADGSVTEDIAGSEYGEFGEVKYITVPAGSGYELTLHGQASGSFSLDIQESSGGVVTASSTIANVPTTANTLASLTISSGLDTASALTIDENGDGEAEISIEPRAGETLHYQPPAPEPEPEPQPQEPQIRSSGSRGGAYATPVATQQAVATTTDSIGSRQASQLQTIQEQAAATTTALESSVATIPPTPSLKAKKKALPAAARGDTPAIRVKAEKESRVAPQTASALDAASQQPFFKKVGSAVYNGLYGFWSALKRFF